jgi:hypothetical protein
MRNLKLTLAALVFAVAACGSSAETERKLAELEQVNSQKDSLMQVAISSRLLGDVNVELTKVRCVRTGSTCQASPITASNDTLLASCATSSPA